MDNAKGNICIPEIGLVRQSQIIGDKTQLETIEIGHSPKTVQLADETKLHFWYANNKGRGRDNCTIIRSSSPRAETSAKQENVIAFSRTSHWAGNVNFSKKVREHLMLV